MAEFQAAMGRPPKYDWPVYLSGGTFTLRRGEPPLGDFTPTPQKFASYLRDKARDVGKKVTVSIDGEEVTFRFYDPPAKDSRRKSKKRGASR